METMAMLERMAEHGTAPEEGCSLFGVGYEEAFERLRRTYLTERFERGGSAEKFVVGPYGSGKTHFLRQLMETARDLNCVTSEVKLDKSVDFTKSLVVYQEVCREIRVPGVGPRGLRSLFQACLAKAREASPDEGVAEDVVKAWIGGIEMADLDLSVFGRVAQTALRAGLGNDAEALEAALRWLSGDVSDRRLARDLSVPVVTKSSENLHARRALMSLFQLIRYAGFRGTVVCFDEAEQGLSVNKRKTEQIMSMLQSDINAIADLRDGSALMVYALTPDLFEKMESFAALQQRVADASPGRGFFDGDTRAPKIDLTQRTDPRRELEGIGRKLVDLLYGTWQGDPRVTKTQVTAQADAIAARVLESDVSSGNRRTMVKRTSAMLVRLHDEGALDDKVGMEYVVDDDEV